MVCRTTFPRLTVKVPVTLPPNKHPLTSTVQPRIIYRTSISSQFTPRAPSSSTGSTMNPFVGSGVPMASDASIASGAFTFGSSRNKGKVAVSQAGHHGKHIEETFNSMQDLELGMNRVKTQTEMIINNQIAIAHILADLMDGMNLDYSDLFNGFRFGRG